MPPQPKMVIVNKGHTLLVEIKAAPLKLKSWLNNPAQRLPNKVENGRDEYTKVLFGFVPPMKTGRAGCFKGGGGVQCRRITWACQRRRRRWCSHTAGCQRTNGNPKTGAGNR